MSHRSYTGKGNAQELMQMIIEDVQNAGVSNSLVDSCVRETDGVRSVFLVFERYYYRSQNRASLSVLIVEDKYGNVTIDAIGSGGGQGVFFSFSWGAEDDFVRILENILKQRGIIY